MRIVAKYQGKPVALTVVGSVKDARGYPSAKAKAERFDLGRMLKQALGFNQRQPVAA